MKYIISKIPIDTDKKRLLDGKNQTLNTPLHWATLNNQITSVEILLSEGCSSSIRNSENETALDIALKYELYNISV